MSPNSRPEWSGAERAKMQTGASIPRPLQADGSAISLRCKLGIRVELKQPAFLAAEGSDWHAFSGRLFRPGPKRSFRLTGMPALDKEGSVGAIRHKSLDHITLALWTRQLFVAHRLLIVPLGPGPSHYNCLSHFDRRYQPNAKLSDCRRKRRVEREQHVRIAAQR